MTDLPAITKPQAEALANLLHQLRPEWGIPALMTLIGKNLAHPAKFPQLAQAAVAAAIRTNPDGSHTARTPAVIYQPGRHWDQPVQETGAVVPQGPPCEDHETESAHNCRCCMADVKVGERPRSHIGKHFNSQQNQLKVVK